jgi:hypothetical protein
VLIKLVISFPSLSTIAVIFATDISGKSILNSFEIAMFPATSFTQILNVPSSSMCSTVPVKSVDLSASNHSSGSSTSFSLIPNLEIPEAP